MIDPVTIAEQLLFSTVQMKIQYGRYASGSGTGFFFIHTTGDHQRLPLLITNNHVVKGSTSGTLCLHEAELIDEVPKPSDQFFPVVFGNFSEYWIPHPDQKIDLCAMPIQPLLDGLQHFGRAVYYNYIDQSFILSDSDLQGLSAVEDILMIGYPIGFSDEVNNLPIFRRGITASHPAINFKGRSEGVIDAACFPGSSGSPVMLVNEGFYKTKTETRVGNRAALLGVLYGGPQWSAEGFIVQEIPTRISRNISHTRVMINLGYYIKAKEILTLGEHVTMTLRSRDEKLWTTKFNPPAPLPTGTDRTVPSSMSYIKVNPTG
ncbi:MAG: trypsin-like peptidase domain-containing protein [Anaerolineales bacterium]|nr:trypsin-like peptidase domain-containing protein [Anaerolineales bacterium]